MPEGDTIHGAADRLDAALGGYEVLEAVGSHRAMREFGRRIVGSTVTRATAHGKHLLIDFSNGWTLRTHLQMTGAWHVYKPDEAWRKSPGKARVILKTSDHVAVCFAAPTVQLAPQHIVSERIERLGPDLMQEQDFEKLADQLRADHRDRPVNEVIVDQAAVAGLGNVYKSELLFEFGLHPDTVLGDVPTGRLADLLARGHAMLNGNRGRMRSTTGSRRPGQMTWVYGRSRETCRRCGSVVEYGKRGPLARDTYWCSFCQPTS